MIPLLTRRRQRVLVNGDARFLHPAFTHTRASAQWGFVNGVLTQFGANAQAWVDAPQGGYMLSIEPQRTNYARNARIEGGATGTPGTVPPNMAVTAAPGMTRQIVSISTSSLGLVNSIVIRWSGTATASTTCAFTYERAAGITGLVPGNVVTQAISARLVDGSLSGVNPHHWGPVVPVSGATVDTQPALSPPISSTLTRYSRSDAVPASGGVAPYSQGEASIIFYVNNGVYYDFTIEFVLPQIELGAAPTSPILPAVGTPAATTRAADLVVCDNIAWLNATRGTIVAEAALSSALVDVIGRSFFTVSDGTNNNRIQAFWPGAQASIATRHSSGGTSASPGNVGALTTSRMRLAYGYDVAASGVGVSLNGAAPVYSSPAAAPVGMNIFIIGGGAGELNGGITYLAYHPQRLSDAQLQVLSAL